MDNDDNERKYKIAGYNGTNVLNWIIYSTKQQKKHIFPMKSI